ncbi:MAG: FAD-dependent thymidylate synthase, partial [Anaerolineales bacterium]
MPNKCRIYLLDPKTLEPETIAVTFAKTSRSPLSFREIADELTAEKSAEFHEKWVVGYGHASVAEHAVLHIAIENVSRVAVETIESNRLASYTEKSTRYQTWGKDDFAVPPELVHHPLESRYLETCSHLFSAYQQALPALKAVAEQENPRLPDESAQSWDRRLRTIYVDVARYFLPAAALANVGMTINARALEHAITKMLSSPLKEVQEIGKNIKQVACAEVPTLIKYAESDPYLSDIRQALTGTGEVISAISGDPKDWCTLIAYDP